MGERSITRCQLIGGTAAAGTAAALPVARAATSKRLGTRHVDVAIVGGR